MLAFVPTRCPVCDYDLRGLPPTHQCPECGFAYDEFTVVWRWKRPRRVYAEIAAVVAFSAGWLLIFAYGRPGWPKTCSVCVLTILIGHLLVRLIRMRPRRAFLAIAPAGVLLRGDGTSTERVIQLPWKVINALKLNVAERALEGDIEPILLGRFLEDAVDAEEFGALLSAARARYSLQSGPP